MEGKYKIQEIIRLLFRANNVDLRTNPSQEGGYDGGPSSDYIFSGLVKIVQSSVSFILDLIWACTWVMYWAKHSKVLIKKSLIRVTIGPPWTQYNSRPSRVHK